MADEKFREIDGREDEQSAVEEGDAPENAEGAEECDPVPDVTKGDDPGWLGCGMASVPHVVPSREQSVFAPGGELPDKFVIAERSGWTALGPIILWTAAVVGAAVFVMSLVFPSDTKGISVYAGVLTGIFVIVAICYTAFCADIPRTIALYEEGKIVLCQTGIIRTSLGAILFGAFVQPKLANMYTIACVPPVQHHPKISCSEVRAVPRLPIFG